MKFVVVSGRSGSGKSSALNLLEDEGYICIDNLPVTLLPALIDQIRDQPEQDKQYFAIGIDARNIDNDLSLVDEVINEIKGENDSYEIVFLDTKKDILFQRFSETRRKHPLSNNNVDLDKAIELESNILAPLIEKADVIIDTSHLSLHELRSLLKRKIIGDESKGLSLIFLSFGFKYGVPPEADFVFDVRCLPNPHWDKKLRPLTGKDEAVIAFLQKEADITKMQHDIQHFIQSWLTSFEQNNRSYLTVAIGCTGGQHRSVYMCEQLGHTFKESHANVQIKHRQFEQS